MSSQTKSISAEHPYQASSSDTSDPNYAENSISSDKENVTFISKIQSKILNCGACIGKLKLEITAFLFTFSYIMTKVTSTNLIIDKVCSIHLEYNSSICENLDNFTDIKNKVEKLATDFQLVRSLIQIAPAAILSCFIGPWSDQYGRKFPIIIALVGMTLDAMGSSVCAYYFESRVEYFFIPAIFTGIFGGPVSVLAVIYSYVSDLTPHLGLRTMKYAFIEMASGFSLPFGITAGGWIFNFLGHTAVFLFSTGGLVLSLIWVIFVLKETRGLDNDDALSTKLQKLFSCKSLSEGLQAVIKDRPHKGRKQVLLLLLSTCFLTITTNSTGDISYLFVHHQFGWSNTTFSTITAVYSVIAIVALIILVPIMKHYRLGDPYLGLIGTISLLGKNLGFAFAWKKGVYHIGCLLGLLSGIAPFAVRSRISKVVSSEELGKVFSIVSAVENLFPVLTTVLMAKLFNLFIETFPGMPYLVQAILLVSPLAVFSWMVCLPKMSYEDIDHTQKVDDVAEVSIESI